MSRNVLACAGVLALASVLEAQTPPVYVPPNIQGYRLIYKVSAKYPELAKKARIQGTVKLAVLIGEDGIVERLKLISGHPLLVKAAFDAVKQWLYEPALRNGVPVAVMTTIEIRFTFDDLFRLDNRAMPRRGFARATSGMAAAAS